MTIPQKFRKANENVITSYDFYDLAAGVGYKILQGADTAHSNDVTRVLLSPNTFYANIGYQAIGGVGTSTINYDMPLNKALTVEGDIIYELNFSSDNLLGVTISAGLFMVDDGVETQIGDYDHGSASVPVNSWDYATITTTLPKTLIAAGKTLRAKFEFAVENGGAMVVLNDPKNRSGLFSSNPTERSTLQIYLPIEIKQ